MSTNHSARQTSAARPRTSLGRKIYADAQAARSYEELRPGYPAATLTALLAGAECPVRIADIGAGTGKLSRQLAARPGTNVFAVEPSPQMRAQLCDAGPADTSAAGSVTVVAGSSEDTGLPDNSIDLAVWAQSFHWVEPGATSVEARRILRPGGRAAVVVNQLDVRSPWVHRLTRIMRSGDVARLDRPPRLPGFETAAAQESWHIQTLRPSQVMALARTRSSYLQSGEPARQKMQANLDWYLHQHLRLSPTDLVRLPYRTLLWFLTPVP